MNKIGIFTLLLTLGASALAADQNPTLPPAQPKSTYFRDDNGTTTFVFKDGREAQFYHGIGAIRTIDVGMKQIENTCNFAQNLSSCQMNIDVASHHAFLVWTKNPDQNKIGKVVNYRSKSQENNQSNKFMPIESANGFISWYPQRKGAFFSKTFNPDQLTCSDLEWAKGFINNQNVLQIHSWSTENMLPTSETGLDENQTSSTTFNIKLAVQGNKLIFKDVGSSYAKINSTGFGPYITGQVVNLNMVTDTNPKQVCQVSFEMNLGKAAAALRDPEFLKMDPSTYKAVGTKYKDLPLDIYFTVGNLLNSPESWEVE